LHRENPCTAPEATQHTIFRLEGLSLMSHLKEGHKNFNQHMQSRFTVTGTTTDDRQVILAYELKEEEFKVNLHVIPKMGLKQEDIDALEKSWNEGEATQFPENTLHINPNLHAESILPDDIRSEEAGKIRNQQNEWAYHLLTAKLWESYLLELDELKKRSAKLEQYDRQLFDDAKSFWERVLEHRKERDISQEGLDKIKDDVNSIFEKLKTFRKTESAEFEATSAKNRDEIIAKLEDIKKRTGSNANFKALLEELKAAQAASRKNRYTKSDDHFLRKACDSTFQFITEQRNHFFNDKTELRLKGLKEVIERMESSLAKDRRDLEYMAKKADSSSIKSLELQLIKVKTNMLNETIASKEEKLKDIRNTLDKVVKQSQRTHKHDAHKEDGAPKENDQEKEQVEQEPAASTGEAAHPDEPNPVPGE
jgi:hypothetical protein